MRSLPGRCHELLHNRAGQLSLDLVHPLRLIFEPANIPIPRKADGGIDWQKVTAVVIIGIVDILAAVKRTAIPKPHDLGFGRELSRTVSASFPKDFSHLPPQIYSVLVIRSLYRLTPQALRPKYFYWR